MPDSKDSPRRNSPGVQRSGVPFNFGLWEGTDGSSVIAALNPGRVCCDRERGPEQQSDVAPAHCSRTGRSPVLSRISCISARATLVVLLPRNRCNGWRRVSPVADRSASFRLLPPVSLTTSPRHNRSALPRYSGEFLLTNHSAGSLTSQAYMKRWNRKNELLARSAEASSVVADWLGRQPRIRVRSSARHGGS